MMKARRLTLLCLGGTGRGEGEVEYGEGYAVREGWARSVTRIIHSNAKNLLLDRIDGEIGRRPPD